MHYYNEWDKKAAAWLRELIKEGLIPQGEVDERSITDVQPGDLRGFVQCHFFAGIGGWPYALSLASWPEERKAWTGSCPCQPLSCAGLGKGHADERHLWPSFYRLISECKPATVFGEQVASKDGREWLSGIRADLEGMGYAVGAADLCAASVGSPHRRQRLFWVADTPSLPGSKYGREPGEGLRRSAGPDDTPNGGGYYDGTMADTERNGGRPGQQEWGPQRRAVDGRDSEDVRLAGNGGVGNAIKPRLEGYAGDGNGGQQPGWQSSPKSGSASEAMPHGFWSNAIWIPTLDPRTSKTVMRRASPEPEVFPLVDGLPYSLGSRRSSRAAILKGAGNSIVPQLAAEFIKAYLETLTP